MRCELVETLDKCFRCLLRENEVISESESEENCNGNGTFNIHRDNYHGLYSCYLWVKLPMQLFKATSGTEIVWCLTDNCFDIDGLQLKCPRR